MAYTSLLDRLGLHRPELRAWALYDVANSAWMTTVMTAVMLALVSGNMLFAYRDVFGEAEPVTKDTEVLI